MNARDLNCGDEFRKKSWYELLVQKPGVWETWNRVENFQGGLVEMCGVKKLMISLSEIELNGETDKLRK